MTTANTEHSYLSPTFQSNAVLAPLDVKRPTISDPNYSRYLSSEPGQALRVIPDATEQGRPRTAGHKWGRHYSYGGIGSSVPHEFTQYDPYGRPFGIRGHDHYSTGASVLPRDVKVDQSYELTALKRSDVRANDELIPRPLAMNMQKDLVLKRFPADHPFTSHTPQRDMFPSIEPPTEGVLDEDTGLPQTKKTAPRPVSGQTTVRHKTRGASARHEKLLLLSEEEQQQANKERPLMHDVWDVDRTERHRRAITYPAPQVLYSARPEQRNPMAVRPRTANALANFKAKACGTPHYKSQHTGRGPQHIDQVDDYDDKKTAKDIADLFPEDRTESWDAQSWKPGQKLKTSSGYSSALKPASAVSRNSAIPPAKFGGDGYTTGYHVAKPREGRHSRTAAANLKVEDPKAVEEYGEMTADGRMRPGTARCRSAGGVRFDGSAPQAGKKKQDGGAHRPGTPWAARPGTGRYRYQDGEDDDDKEEDAGGRETSGEESEGEEDIDRGFVRRRSDTDLGGSTPWPPPEPSDPWPPGEPRRQASCPYDNTNFADGWRPGTGVPRPKSTFHERQAGFKKSAVHEQLHQDFPETMPDVRDNQQFPGNKRHLINGAHSYWYHHG